MKTGISLGALVMLLAFHGAAPAGEGAPERLDELLVTPTRRPAPVFSVPWSAETVGTERLSGSFAPRNLPDALGGLVGVQMQKTGYGQGSPYIRGLTGFRTLLLVDGIRLNNSVFRDGPNQYVNTVDHLSLSTVELIRGPASAQYGSDSMGGTLNLLPLLPREEGGEYAWHGRFYERLALAETSSVSRIELQGGSGADFGFLAGFNVKSFGDLEAGDGMLDGTGYAEWDADARFLLTVTPDLDLTLAWQHVTQKEVPRTHKTLDARAWHGTTLGNERRRDLDQVRDLVYLRASLDADWAVADRVQATLSWHRQDETRHRVRGDGRSDRQGVAVDTLGFTFQGEADADFGTITWGADAYRDSVSSWSRSYNAGGSLKGTGIQGPVADDATYDLLGAFLQGEVPLGDGWTFIAGLRGTRVSADADKVEDPVSGNEIGVSDHWSALVGSARISYLGIEGLCLYGGVSQGFRAPNLSDLTRLDSARSNEIETPSPGLDPERALSFEIGARLDTGRVQGEIALFHTELADFIQRFPTGEVIDGDIEVTRDNVGDGFVRGIELGLDVDLGAGFTAFGGAAFLTGRADTYPTSERKKSREHLDRLPPLTGHLGVRFLDDSGLTAEARVSMADKADRLSTRDEGDTQRIPPGGTPGYAVIDLMASYPVADHMTVTLGIANLLDKAYRIHGSGLNEPGLNLWLAFELRF